MSEQGGPLLPVVVSTDKPQGGPAQRVVGYTSAPAGRPVAGGPAQPVYVVSAAELASGAFVAEGAPMALPLIAVTDGRPVAGGRPIAVVVVSGSLDPVPPIAAPTDWWDSAFERRLRISATNTSGGNLHDHLISYSVPADAAVDAGSLRVVELTALGGIDKAFDWRYAPGGTSLNHMSPVPAFLSGGVITFKALGKWANGETRSFGVYWSATGGQTQPNYTHLDAVAPTWVATAIAGTTGDVYTLVVGGTTYSYTMVGGDTATTIGTALRAAINGGSVATASGSAGTINVVSRTPRDITFTVANTGTTVLANLAVTKPTFWTLGRVGPDTAAFAPASFTFGLPYGTNAGGVVASRVAWGRGGTTNQAVRTMGYKVNGDATTYGTTDATLASLTVNGPTVSVAGAITFSTRAAGVDWAASWSGTYRQRIYVGDKSDGLAPGTLNKYVDVMRVTLTYTCQRAHTPTGVAAGATTPGGYDVLAFGSLDNTFSGNVTEAAGNRIANFYKEAGGALTSYAASANLTGLVVVGTIIGSHGNTNACAILINSLTLAGFGSQAPQAVWMSQGNAYGVLSLRNLVTSTTIPAGATITVDFWYVNGKTISATTIGDNLLPTEVVEIVEKLGYTPTLALIANETYTSDTLAQTMLAASSRAADGAAWFQANALAKTNRANNYVYQWNAKTGAVSTTDDDDGNYGAGHALHGLCLRYLRTHDAALIPLIEAQVQFHLDIEAAAVSAYGSFWNGTAPYWYWPKATSSGGQYTFEAAVPPSSGSTLFDPAVGTFQTIDYTQGQVRRATSIDQMHMVAHGLYAYLYLLRNESAITANTTLRANALSYVSRMATFQTTYITPLGACAIPNLYALLTGGASPIANGITATQENPVTGVALANPYYGQQFGSWEVSNGSAIVINPSANSSLDRFFASVYASNSVQSGVLRFLQGRAMDMLMSDFGRHDVTQGAANSANGVIGKYPFGWNVRAAASGNTAQYASPRTVPSNNGFSSDLHTIQANDTGARDMLSGRAAQRLIVLCFTALIDPSTAIPVEMSGSTVLRSVPVLTAIDDLARVLSLYGIEPTTKAQRFTIAGYFGKSSSYDPQVIDSAFTGYWLMASELWFLVQQRVAGTFNPATYYKFG